MNRRSSPFRTAFPRLAPALLASLLGLAPRAPAAPPAPPAVPAPTATPTPTPTPAAAGRLRNTLRWKTASELDNVGFDVYRSNEENGTFERLTSRPVPGGGTTDEPRDYTFVDESVEPEKSYWYYVESISLTGRREKFTPTFRAPVRKAPGPTPRPGPPSREPR